MWNDSSWLSSWTLVKKNLVIDTRVNFFWMENEIIRWRPKTLSLKVLVNFERKDDFIGWTMKDFDDERMLRKYLNIAIEWIDLIFCCCFV